MLHFEMRAEYKCYQIWSNSMKNHTYGIYIALVCCDNRSFCLRSFKDRGKFLGNNSYRVYHRYKFQIACQYNLLPTFVNLIENAIVITGVTVIL